MPDQRTRVLLAASVATLLSGAAMAQTAPNGTTAPAGTAPEALLAALDAARGSFRGGAPTDDVAALALRPRTG